MSSCRPVIRRLLPATSLALALLATALPARALELAPGAVEPGEVVHAAVDKPAAPAASSGPRLVSVIVKLADAPLAVAGESGAGLAPASAEGRAYLGHLAGKHAEFAAAVGRAVPGARVVHSFRVGFGGVSVVLPEDRLADVAALPGVVAVYPDELLQPQTEVSPQFIGAPTVWTRLGGVESAGEGVIVGVLDTGIWPEHPSFADPDPSGKAYAAPPVAPGANGFAGAPRSTCDFGNTAFNAGDAPFACNNKLIGAYKFLDTYKAMVGLLPAEFDSARDADGHGTHTTSTAAGNTGVAASVGGAAHGLVSGVAPRAHVVMYRVCGDLGCYNSDSAAAVEQAVLDGVDVVNFSIGGGSSPYTDVVSQAFFAAYGAGVFVAASAGNSGPTANTVAHREPWTTTVAASTADRQFLSTVSLTAGNGDTLTLTGVSITAGIGTATPVIFPPAGQEWCDSEFPPGTFAGEIVICIRGHVARVAKSNNVLDGGAGGLLLYNDPILSPAGTSADNHFLPTVHLESDAGTALLTFMGSHTGVTATFTQGTAAPATGDVVAAFSSRGGSAQTLGVSKPDIAAPGVLILAGHTPMPATIDGGAPGELFQAIQGTSMASPHIAGAAALLRDLRPAWTPGQVKSALMTTALTAGLVKEDGTTPAGPFDAGSGRVDLTRAGNPGLTFDETAANLAALEAQLWKANLPSVYYPGMPGIAKVRRVARSVLGGATCWSTSVDHPADFNVRLPRTICVDGRRQRAFTMTLDASTVPVGETRHATVNLRSGRRRLHLPVTVVRGQPDVVLASDCAPGTIAVGATTSCTLTVDNLTYAPAAIKLRETVPGKIKILGATLVGATRRRNVIRAQATLSAAAPPDVAIGPGTSPGGYLPLSLFAIAPLTAGDETFLNFDVPAFLYGGETYTRIGMSSNGYVVVGGGTSSDNLWINTNLPDAARPNNVLAPFWTDLNPGAGGAMRIGRLTDGTNTWIVCDWEQVANFSSAGTNSFQAWIREGAVEDITFTYGPDLTAGNGGFLTVGAENRFGNRGAVTYYNGAGTLPTPTTELAVTTTPPVPGGQHVVTYDARGNRVGLYTKCAKLTSDAFADTSVVCFGGEVTP